jgi:hypothetical protein
MIMTTTRRKRAHWHRQLLCHVRSLSYDWTTRTGELRFPLGNCCDMDGAVRLFQSIDPEVRVIRTYAGARPETWYERIGGSWTAYLEDQGGITYSGPHAIPYSERGRPCR